MKTNGPIPLLNDTIFFAGHTNDEIFPITHTLKEAGYQLQISEVGKSVLQIIKSTLPVLILISAKLPDMDCFELCRMIKETDDVKNIPLLLMNDVDDEEKIMLGYACGAQDIIHAGIKPRTLLAKLNMFIKQRHSQLKIQEENNILYTVIVKNKLAEITLRKSEERYRSFVENANDIIFSLSPEGILNYISPNWASFLGHNEKDFIGKSVFDTLIHPEDIPQLRNLIQQGILTGKKQTGIQYRAKHKNGNWHWHITNASPVFDSNGTIISLLGIANDITEQKKTQDALKESEEKLSKVFHLSPDAILITSISDGLIVDANERTFELSGYSRSEIIGKKTLELNGWLNMEDRVKYVSELSKNGRVLNLEKKLNNKHGETRYTTISGELMEIKGEKFILTVIHDITDLKRKEEECKKREIQLHNTLRELSEYKYALDHAANVSITDKDGIITYVNESFCNFYGYKQDEIIGQNHNILNSGFHSLEFWKNFWKTIQNGEVLKAEVKNKSKDGKFYWADTTIVPFLNELGMVYQYLAIRIDITEKRKLKTALADEQLNSQRFITELTIQEQENVQNKISNELHENINQILAGAKIYLGIAQTKSSTNDPLLDKSYDHLNEAMELISKLSNSLVIPALKDNGFLEILEALVNEINKTNTIHVTLVNEVPTLELLEKKQILLIYRIVQEQLNNIISHAKAHSATILLKIVNGNIFLSICDDGEGFEVTKNTVASSLLYIKNRLEFYSGTFYLDSTPGDGCNLEITIPLKIDQSVSSEQYKNI